MQDQVLNNNNNYNNNNKDRGYDNKKKIEVMNDSIVV